jgi:hypothetical protein
VATELAQEAHRFVEARGQIRRGLGVVDEQHKKERRPYAISTV